MIVTKDLKSAFLPIVLISNLTAVAQTPATEVLAINANVDASVMMKDVKSMERLFAGDLVFTHGTGLVDSKSSWLKAVLNPEIRYLSRMQDSTQVEMHGDVAIVTGRLDIERERGGDYSKYGLWYIRVFVRKARQWQLVSHRTTRWWQG